MLATGPFTQRVLLTIEEKHLPYELKLVDLANKPDWYLSSRQVSCGAAPMQGNGAPETYAAPSSTLLGPRRGPLGMQSRLSHLVARIERVSSQFLRLRNN